MQNDFCFVFDTNEHLKYTKFISRDSKEIKKSLHVQQNIVGTFVYALCVHESLNKNKKIEIKNSFGNCLTPEVYDTVRDLFCFEGVDICHIGFVPISYRIMSPESDWDCYVPLPFSLIKKYLNKEEINNFSKWSSQYKDQNFKIQLIQFVG
jgi:hypothetical protein